MRKIFLICICLFIPVILSAEDDFFIRKQKSFIDKLYREHRYFDAIAETEKLKVYSRNTDSTEPDYFICMNYYLAEQYRTAIALCTNKNFAAVSLPDFIRSASYLKLKRYDDSYRSLSPFSYIENNPYNIELFRRRVEPLLLSGRLKEIEAEELAASGYLTGNLLFSSLRDELDQYRNIGLKSPAGAAAMSAVIPGLGQIYSGYLSDGLISFVSVAVTALGGAYMNKKGNSELSYTLYFFSALFYTGNIYGGYNSCRKRNERTLDEWDSAINSRFGEFNPADYYKTGAGGE